ncbi:MAG: DUF4124 domain-containing protein [Gammaproteobacteria bacterium]
MYKRILVMLLATLVMSAVLADGTIYKWVDKNGNVHYSTVPQSPNAQALNIVDNANTQAPTASSAPSAASSAKTNQALTTITPGDSAACKSARETLLKYLGASYLYTVDQAGEKQHLPKQQQDMAVIQAKNAVTEACTPHASSP